MLTLTPRRRPRIRVLGPALLLAGVLALTPGTAYAAYYPGVAHADGYLTASGGCLMLREHDGRVYSVIGNVDGLLTGDHVRLEGRLVPDPGCGAPGFQATMVQALWGDDYHRTTLYDHLNGEPFYRWSERSGRLGGYPDDRDRDRDRGSLERYDRYGHYVYHGPRRAVELVGRLHEVAGGCPTLDTGANVFALDGNLRDYQAGDRVRVSGILYDDDPNAPCGSPTVVISSIRGR
jgi:hypothetical protein